MRRDEHPVVVRLCHWAFALALGALIGSGLEVFAAFPAFGEKIPQADLFVPPSALRLGGWLGGARQWPMARHYLLFGPKPTVTETYNPLQKMAYSVALLLIVVSIVTGFALYKPVHLSWLVDVLGGFRLTRVWHFAAMCGCSRSSPATS